MPIKMARFTCRNNAFYDLKGRKKLHILTHIRLKALTIRKLYLHAFSGNIYRQKILFLK